MLSQFNVRFVIRNMKNIWLILLLLFSIFSSAKSIYERNALFLQRKPTVKFQRYRHLQANPTSSVVVNPWNPTNTMNQVNVNPSDPSSPKTLQNDLDPTGNRGISGFNDPFSNIPFESKAKKIGQNLYGDVKQGIKEEEKLKDPFTNIPYEAKAKKIGQDFYGDIKQGIKEEEGLKDPFTNIPYEVKVKHMAKHLYGDITHGIAKEEEMPHTIDELSDQVQGMAEKFKDVPGMGFLTEQSGPLAGLIPAIDSTTQEEAQANLDSDYVTAEGEPVLPPNVDELLSINLDDTGTLDQSYISIASDIKVYETTYIDCMAQLSDLDFTQANIDNCNGRNYRFVNDDIEYFKRKILAKADSIIQSRMVEECFKVAGTDLVMANGCDLLQKDALKLLWAELNYYLLIDYHRNKYIFQNSNLPTDLVDQLMREFKSLYKNQDELLGELYNHKTLTIQRIADYIADRNYEIAEDIQENGPLNLPVVTNRNVIRVDSARQKLLALNQIRRSEPWVMYKTTARKTKEVNGLNTEFVSPWGKDKSAKYGRTAEARKLIGNGENRKLLST